MNYTLLFKFYNLNFLEEKETQIWQFSNFCKRVRQKMTKSIIFKKMKLEKSNEPTVLETKNGIQGIAQGEVLAKPDSAKLKSSFDNFNFFSKT